MHKKSHLSTALIISGAFAAFANAGIFEENFDSGNYDGWNLHTEWTFQEGSWGVSASSGHLRINRSGSSGAYGNFGIQHDLAITVSDLTEINFDIAADSRNVRGGDGDSHGEYPASVELALITISGTARLRFAYNYDGATTDIFTDDFVQIATDAPQGQWQFDQNFRIRDHFSDAIEISSIDLYANGWDYEARFDNIIITPSPAGLTLLCFGCTIGLRRSRQR